MRALNIAYQPGGKIGGFDFAAHIVGGPQGIDISNLDLKQGELRATGTANIALDATRPVITANIQTGNIIVDPFLPADPVGSSDNGAASTGSTTSSGADSASGTGPSAAPWPRDPLDLGALNDLDADIRFQSTAIQYDAITIADAIIVAKLSGGVLTVENVSGVLFGGALELNGVLDARNVPAFESTLSFENGNIGTLLSAMTGEPSAVGTMAVRGNFAANGQSVSDMISTLDGAGSFGVTGLDVTGDGDGTPLAGIVGLVRSIGLLGAGMDVSGLADAKGSFTINDGVVQIDDFDLNSGFGTGTATGFVDLAGWNMEVAGMLQLKQNILTALLAKSTGAMDTLPFSITGAPDSPNINIETASLLPGGGGIPIPGIDILEEKLPGVGAILQGILGGGSSQPSSQPAPSSSEEETPEPQQQSPEPQKLSPTDILNQLFKF